MRTRTNPSGDQFTATPGTARVIILHLLVGLGIAALIYYFTWWFDPARLRSAVLMVILAAALVAAGPQLAGNWLLYLKVRRRRQLPPQAPQLSVDVFVTACNEPYSMVQTTLAAACALRGAHTTWLLDDGHSPALKSLAQQLGAGYLTRSDKRDAKAGNLNAALKVTHGDIVVVFDIDHVPDASFLERTLNYFNNPKMGFVQVMLTFSNGENSWVARAANESSLDYYNPASRGADGLRGATLTGSNALIRRAALESIGGYQPGLAEDLATSIALHAAGWSSTYVAEPLAPGLAPEDLTGWFTQQLKWSRGVFDLLIHDYLRHLPRLTWGQRLTYAVRMTYYWIGAALAVHLLGTLFVLFNPTPAVITAANHYLIHFMPLVLAALLIRQHALSTFRHPTVNNGMLFRPMLLIFATWPVYTLAWLMALAGVPLRFRLTPKGPGGSLNPVWLLPQVITIVLLAVGSLHAAVAGRNAAAVILFAVVQVLAQIPMLVIWLMERSSRPAANQTESA